MLLPLARVMHRVRVSQHERPDPRVLLQSSSSFSGLSARQRREQQPLDQPRGAALLLSALLDPKRFLADWPTTVRRTPPQSPPPPAGRAQRNALPPRRTPPGSPPISNNTSSNSGKQLPKQEQQDIDIAGSPYTAESWWWKSQPAPNTPWLQPTRPATPKTAKAPEATPSQPESQPRFMTPKSAPERAQRTPKSVRLAVPSGEADSLPKRSSAQPGATTHSARGSERQPLDVSGRSSKPDSDLSSDRDRMKQTTSASRAYMYRSSDLHEIWLELERQGMSSPAALRQQLREIAAATAEASNNVDKATLDSTAGEDSKVRQDGIFGFGAWPFKSGEDRDSGLAGPEKPDALPPSTPGGQSLASVRTSHTGRLLSEAEVRAELDCLLNLRRQRRIFTPKQRSLTPAERRAARERLTGSDAKLNVKLYA